MLPAVDDIRKLLAAVDDVAVTAEPLGVVARVPLASAKEAVSALKDGGYESLVDFDGIDTGEHIEVTYRMRSYSLDSEVHVKSCVAYDGTLASVWEVCPAVLMPERETAELFGLHLDGHPNPKRLLTTDGMPPLLRKSVAIRTPEEFRR